MRHRTYQLRPLRCGTVRTIHSWSMLLVQFCHGNPDSDDYIKVHSCFYIGKN